MIYYIKIIHYIYNSINMPVKFHKNKLNLHDELEEENYIVNNVTDIVDNKDHIPTPPKKITTSLKKESPGETRKSPYILFVSKMTDKFKVENPSMSAKERREKVLSLWKLEKDK